MFQKQKRVIDKKLMKSYHTDKECVICGKAATPAHIKGHGAFGNQTPENLAPLCGEHHTEQGQCGMTTFADRYQPFRMWLFDNGWEFDQVVKKWRRYT